jgi:hypothetical protein
MKVSNTSPITSNAGLISSAGSEVSTIVDIIAK